MALKAFDDYSAVSVLIDFLKDHVYHYREFGSALWAVEKITGREDLKNTKIIAKRQAIVADLDQWWQRNKGKSLLYWFADLLLTASDHQTKFQAARQLGEIGDISALPALREFMSRSDESPAMIGMIIPILLKIGGESTIDVIKPRLYGPGVYLRKDIALTLHAMGDDSGVPVMIASLQAPRLNTRSVANYTLKEITGQDFTGSKSLRYLPPEKQDEVIAQWQSWWEHQDGEPLDADTLTRLKSVLNDEPNQYRQQSLSVRQQEQNHPGYPGFEDPCNTPLVTFKQLKQALLADDIEQALLFIAPHKKEYYRKVFERNPPMLYKLVDRLGDIYYEQHLGRRYQYTRPLETDNGVIPITVVFLNDGQGQWLIDTL